jgi:nucleoside-diphosphate-sugar epimerase
MPRTLVTGAAGFTGRYLVRLLADQGDEVHGVVHETPDRPVDGISRVHVADLADHLATQQVVEAVRPDHIVHLAAIAFVAHQDVEAMYRSNIVGTRNLLDALARSGLSPSAVIVASSANIYGNARGGVLDEKTTAAPANDYGISKVATELVTHLYRDQLPLILVRPFNYTGVGQDQNFLVPKIVDHFRRRAPVIELGNIEVARDFSDVRTIVDAYARLLRAPNAIGQTFNISSGQATPLRAVIDACQEITGHRLEVKVNPGFVRANEVKTLAGSAARLVAAIGPLREIPLIETLRWMLES